MVEIPVNVKEQNDNCSSCTLPQNFKGISTVRRRHHKRFIRKLSTPFLPNNTRIELPIRYSCERQKSEGMQEWCLSKTLYQTLSKVKSTKDETLNSSLTSRIWDDNKTTMTAHGTSEMTVRFPLLLLRRLQKELGLITLRVLAGDQKL